MTTKVTNTNLIMVTPMVPSNPKLYAIAFTWSPRPLLGKHKSAKLQFRELIRLMKYYDFFKQDVHLVPELNKAGMIHFHAQMNIVDSKKWYNRTLPSLKNLGFVKIKDIKSKGWSEYLKKDQSRMEYVLGIKLPLYEYPFLSG